MTIDYENVYFECEGVDLLSKQFHLKYCSYSLYFHEIHLKEEEEEEDGQREMHIDSDEREDD